MDVLLSPLFLAPSFTLENKSYKTSYYGGAEIRYKNIASPEELSIDFTIFRNKLIVGTTKMTTRTIIDYLTANAPPDSITNSPEIGTVDNL